nr:family 49 glycosyl hydrolase [Pseudarthrobacter sp. SSS035]
MRGLARRAPILDRVTVRHVKNLNIDSWNGLDRASQVIHLKRYTNAAGE